MRKLIKFLTSRFFILGLLLFGELVFVVCFCVYFAFTTPYGFLFLLICWLVNIPFLVFILNSKASTAYKMGWSLIVSIIPGGGALFYFLFANKRDTKRQRQKLKPYISYLCKYNSNSSILESIKQLDSEAYLHSKYIYNKSKSLPYKNTYTKYFKLGEEAWPVLLEELKKAKHFIFIEYYIIEDGKFWNSILDILIEKVKEGLDVRILYDDFGCMTKVSYFYYKKLQSYGINAKIFQRYKLFLDVKMNNRDHRKILIIDGHTSFTGGINFADEYVNEVVRFGQWKDNGILIKGEATFGLTNLFLSMWDNYLKIEEDFNDFSYEKYKDELEPLNTKGYVQPYGDIPFDYESVGENVYLNLINRAKSYVYISTPYLVLDATISNALITASRSGIDVRIVLPGIPDKKIVYQLSKANAFDLLKSGVKIYYYAPGFNHGKTFLVDDKFATVGTINLDLRSFYLNYENGVFMYDTEVIQDIKDDFEYMFTNSVKSKKKKVGLFKKIWWAILKCFAPML